MIGQLVSELFLSESVNGRTDGRRFVSHPISSPRAFGSDELEISILALDQERTIFIESKFEYTQRKGNIQV